MSERHSVAPGLGPRRDQIGLTRGFWGSRKPLRPHARRKAEGRDRSPEGCKLGTLPLRSILGNFVLQGAGPGSSRRICRNPLSQRGDEPARDSTGGRCYELCQQPFGLTKVCLTPLPLHSARRAPRLHVQQLWRAATCRAKPRTPSAEFGGATWPQGSTWLSETAGACKVAARRRPWHRPHRAAGLRAQPTSKALKSVKFLTLALNLENR